MLLNNGMVNFWWGYSVVITGYSLFVCGGGFSLSVLSLGGWGKRDGRRDHKARLFFCGVTAYENEYENENIFCGGFSFVGAFFSMHQISKGCGEREIGAETTRLEKKHKLLS